MKTLLPRVVVVGAGIGGLTTAALLARAGIPVTVLEAHIYAGGCSGTFYHQGFRFDAGATLAGGFYAGGPMDLVAQETGIEAWPARPTTEAMTVRLPDDTSITRYGDDRRWAERTALFGEDSLPFWRWQERTADLLWNLAIRSPNWPPQSPHDIYSVIRTGLAVARSQPISAWRPSLVLDAARSLGDRWSAMPERLRLFIDGQLLIAAQTVGRQANALYAASALDLPRRGVVHLSGGMGAMAETLANSIKAQGGQVLYRQRVKRIVMERKGPKAVETERGDIFDADVVIMNLPPGNIAKLLGDQTPAKIAATKPYPDDAWGAVTVYAGVDSAAVTDNHESLHHQIIQREPLGEGNSIFVSVSPTWDDRRAPQGQRAITLSTHTRLQPWWTLFNHDRDGYEQRKQSEAEAMLATAERVFPGLRDACSVVLPGTPVTFQRFTGRTAGWVGGYPQRNLFRTWGPKLGKNLWMVGDSIFPGQSTAAVALGGRRVARALLAEFA